MVEKPILIYDGDCGFCRAWIRRWQILTQNQVNYAPYQETADRFPEIPRSRFEQSVVFIEPGGGIYYAAEAVLRSLAVVPSRRFWLKLYLRFPLWARASEYCYRLIARHRGVFSRISLWLWGRHLEPSTYFLSRAIFLGLLGLIYFFAFASLRVQVEALLGSEGILSAARYLDNARKAFGAERFWMVPTIFWIHASDAALKWACNAGIVISLILAAGILRVPALILLWALYLSFVSVGQEFFGFQWDNLLLETGFLAALLALSNSFTPRFLLKCLLFKLMLLSGAVKLLSADLTWRNLTALNFHYETQPLPTRLAWYLHQLPDSFQKFSTFAVFVIELAIPFLIFAPRRLRHFGALIMIVFQILIMAAGNYCFFNLLTIALCLPLLDDAFWKDLFSVIARIRLPNRFKEIGTTSISSNKAHPVVRMFLITLALVWLSLSFFEMWITLSRRAPFPQILTVLRAVAPLRTINGYGLFAVMTTRRVELVVEGSNDNREWKEYSFKYKPGDVTRPPRFNIPHQPRLDWQMWFAALSPFERNPWYLNFLVRLLQGSPPVLDLLEKNPFPDKPPRYLRTMAYDYHFTTPQQRRASGAWWRRQPLGLYGPVISLK